MNTDLADILGPDVPPFNGHVLHVVDRAVAARWGPMLRQTLWALGECGASVSLLTNDGELIDSLHDLPVNCHWHEHLSGWRAWQLARLLPARFGKPPAIVHLWGTSGLSWVGRWARRTNVPLVVHVLGQHSVDRFKRRGLRQHEFLAIPTEALAAPLAAQYPLATDRWQVLPPSVAPRLHREPALEAERTLGVLAICHLHTLDGLETLLDAIVQLRQSECDVQVAVIGDGQRADDAWQCIQQRSLNDCCVLIDDIRLWEKGLAGADVCVIPACQRDLWLAPLLAMGLDKLVISSRDQLAHWFVEDETTWQFTPGAAVELAYLLTRVIEQPKRVRVTTAAAADYLRENHAVGDMVRGLLTLYERAVRESAPMPSGGAK